jgi:6-pyruvoyltetrahydropterin/6-carboxytetrahydropterin synthase
MYSISVKRDFIAQHYLIGGNWGAENQPHSHHYVLELILEGAELDRHGYLVDIVDIENSLETLTKKYRDHMLNELPDFDGLNPSIEHFSRILCLSLAAGLHASNITLVTVKLWENDSAWAAYQHRL